MDGNSSLGDGPVGGSPQENEFRALYRQEALLVRLLTDG